MNHDDVLVKSALVRFRWKVCIVIALMLFTSAALVSSALVLGGPFSIPWTVFLLIVSFSSFSVAVIRYLFAPFDPGMHWRQRATLVVSGYICLVVTFGAFYFYFSAIDDYNRAAKITGFSRDIVADPANAEKYRTLRDREIDRNVFHGHEHRIYSETSLTPTLTKSGRVVMANLQWSEVPDSIAEFLHFSLVTAATVGYGDMYPAQTATRMLVDIEILLSTMILVFGLAFIMSGKIDEGGVPRPDHSDMPWIHMCAPSSLHHSPARKKILTK